MVCIEVTSPVMNTEPLPLVSEMPGAYGPYTLSELVLQKIWHRRLYSDHHLRTLDGRRLHIIHPGRWNRQEGPDFLGAEFLLEETHLCGDVEIHFRLQDWQSHGHSAQPAFSKVALHVVLFPPQSAPQMDLFAPAPQIPVLVLLPYLLHDLEEYASLDELGLLDSAQALGESWRELPENERRHRLQEKALQRWRQKLCFANTRLGYLGWENLCHQTALEILGYRRNRAPMTQIGILYPLSRLLQEMPSPDQLVASVQGWKLSGLRPANHPRQRLAQYLEWIRQVPLWPEQLRDLRLPTRRAEETASAWRQKVRLPVWRKSLCLTIVAGQITGPRFDTLVCDGFLPLLAVAGIDEKDCLACWLHWYPGDVPQSWRTFLQAAGLTENRSHPISHGLLQGVLQVFLEQQDLAEGRGKAVLRHPRP